MVIPEMEGRNVGGGFSLTDLLQHLFGGDSDPWGNGGNIWSGTGGVPDMADAMGDDLRDVAAHPGTVLNDLASRTPDETIVQPTIKNWSNPNDYATRDPLWFLSDVAGAAAGAKGMYAAARESPSLARLAAEERGGGTFGHPDSVDAGELFDEAIKRYQKQRQPELRGPIEERTPADLSPEGQGIRALLEKQLGEETYQSPTMDPAKAMRAEAEARQFGRTRRMMEEQDYTGHNTPMKLREDSSPHRPGASKVGGEGAEDPYASLSERRSNTRNLRDFPADQALDVGRGPHPEGGAFSYEAGVGIRDNMDVPSPKDVARFYEHETDIGNIEGIRKSGLEARFDPAEEGRRFVSARDWKGEGEIPKGRARVKFRSEQEPIRRPGLNAVKFKEGIRPEDIVGIERSTLDDLTDALAREGTPEGHGRFVPKYRPKPEPRRVVPTPTPQSGQQR
jgi:hypothetical protein